MAFMTNTLVYIRNTVVRTASARQTTVAAICTCSRVGGSTKFGMTPSGGGKPGQLSPGGRAVGNEVGTAVGTHGFIVVAVRLNNRTSASVGMVIP